MSRIGKKPITIPDNVQVKIKGEKIVIKGPKGNLFFNISPEISVEIKDKNIIISPKYKDKKTDANWGTTRAIIANHVKGVVDGYEKKLELRGIGYKAAIQNDNLVLNVGFSHQINFKIPEQIEITVNKNIITISGIDKELVGQIAAKIRKIRKPDVYKGKGIRYLGERVRQKQGKKGVGIK